MDESVPEIDWPEFAFNHWASPILDGGTLDIGVPDFDRVDYPWSWWIEHCPLDLEEPTPEEVLEAIQSILDSQEEVSNNGNEQPSGDGVSKASD